MQAVAVGAAVVGVGLGIGGALMSRDGLNYAQTHDLRRRPAPITVWNSMGKIVLPTLGGLALMAGALKMPGSAAVAAYTVGSAVALGGAMGSIWALMDSVEVRRGQRELAPGYG